MQIPDTGTGEVVTPIDDPCQFDPAWRACVAQYLFDWGVRTKEDMESIVRFGGVSVSVSEPVKESQDKKPKKGKAKPKKRSVQVRTFVRPLFPFDESAEYRCLAADPWIIAMVGVLDAVSRNYPATKEDAGIRLAKRWYEERDHEAAMKKRLEPLLLTGIGMDVITLDLHGMASAQPAFEAYERLYFNCRDENWKLNPSGQLIQRMAMPYGQPKTFMRKWEELDDDGFIIGDGRPIAKDSDVWKAIAATMGYEALIYTWKWENFAHGLKDRSLENMLDLSWKVAASRLFTALYTGDILYEDAARILAAYTAQSKKISDDRESRQGSGEGDTTNALLSILRLVAPKMVTFSESDEKARNEEIQGRIAAQLAISKTAVDDKGPQVEAEVIDAQIKGALSNDG